jgi:hypothetical protein
MAAQVIAENCYTCINCLVSKQVCQLKRQQINNISIDKCDKYSPRTLEKCELCNSYVIGLAQHVAQLHKRTMSEYKVLTKNKITQKTTIRGKTLWE